MCCQLAIIIAYRPVEDQYRTEVDFVLLDSFVDVTLLLQAVQIRPLFSSKYGHLTSSLFQTGFILNKAVGRDSEPAYDRSFTINLLNRCMFDEI